MSIIVKNEKQSKVTKLYEIMITKQCKKYEVKDVNSR